MRRRRLRDALDGPRSLHDDVTLIASGFTFEGELTTGGAVILGGTVRGKIETGGALYVAVGGVVEGPVCAAAALIDGTLRGELVSSGAIEVGPRAVIEGRLEGEHVTLVEGAHVSGSVVHHGRLRETKERRATGRT